MNTNKLNYLLLFSIFILFSCSSDSEDPTPSPDTIAPELEFSIPGSSSGSSGSETPIVSNQLVVEINAEDAGGIDKVEAFLNNEKVGEDTTAPYQITIDVSGYTSKNSLTNKFTDYTLRITVTDTSGNETSEEQIIHIDNEIPVISEVSLSDGQIIGGDSNQVTFNVSDNEGLMSIKTYLNETLLEEITEDIFEVNLSTLALVDGENTFKIEAVDLAENTANYEVAFISDNTGPAISLAVTFEKLYDPTTIEPDVSDQFSEVKSVEFLIGNESLALLENEANPSYLLIPDNIDTGVNTLTIKSLDNLSNESVLEIPLSIERKLITINIPEDRLHPAIVVPIVFISKMDGSMVTYQEILRDDREIVLSTPEEFTDTDEFMLTFFLQDNSGTSGISTHQNLTRSTPGVINLPSPKRLMADNSYEIPAINFLSTDSTHGTGGEYLVSTAEYHSYLNTTEGNFSISSSAVESTTNRYDSFYLYKNNGGYSYRFIDNPVDNNFVLDANDFINDGVETQSFTVNSTEALFDQISNLIIYGYQSQNDFQNKLSHQIYHSSFAAHTGTNVSYQLNTGFDNYQHFLLFGKYYTYRNGPPIDNYSIPDLSFTYSKNNNIVDLNIQGENHVVGRMQCIDFDNLNYDWYITFNSESTTSVVLPEFPDVIDHYVNQAQQDGNIKIESIELLSYESIFSYDEYVEQVVKDQKNVLDVTDWYQLIFESRTGNFNLPNKEFIFQ
ncbi:Ig-like domain-containing protein [Flagellimonas zhangzhouensis]|uniref:Cadherin domain-containing protein n=1 Tax=Flagellimonas zhangzhouensis TaxID=1073328 RepID=A0A1H2Y1G7_9FLAO|nr:Ig-like domain-containing protein [Allomuricauda zhangzhouensis]SDQ94425.1 hypothetical protein SAMN05216294_2945 [Allomuricauda zhangzhouensis]SDW99053.1 hypothetical protein SAMN04487892_2937 [Allomuricauda zhangzhouensis]